MDEVKKSRQIQASAQLDDVSYLFHRIQSFLPVKEAARTCVLSKAWLQAWSTIPVLKFRQMFPTTEQRRKQLAKVVECTLLRYLQHNIPIQTVDLQVDVDNHELASRAQTWIRQVATKASLNKIILVFFSQVSFDFPSEIYLCKNLSEITVMAGNGSGMKPVWMSGYPMIKCVALRVINLIDVHITEDVLDNLLSTCSLLEEITLICKGLSTIKVKNHRRLSRLKIILDKEDDVLEVTDVPNLGWFFYDYKFLPVSLNMDPFVRVTSLSLCGVKLDDAFLNTIESKFHFLESLTLQMSRWAPRSVKLTSLPLMRLCIYSGMHNHISVSLQVYAPKLAFFSYSGTVMPRLEFPESATGMKIRINLSAGLLDQSFFIELIESFMSSLSTKYYVKIRTGTCKTPPNIDVDDLKRRVSYPATNVEKLSFNEGSWEHAPVFDAFFAICHPKEVVAIKRGRCKSYFCELMVREVIEKKTRNGSGCWPDYLKDVEIKNPNNGKWEKLTDSWVSFLDGSTSSGYRKVGFKLNWR